MLLASFPSYTVEIIADLMATFKSFVHKIKAFTIHIVIVSTRNNGQMPAQKRKRIKPLTKPSMMNKEDTLNRMSTLKFKYIS